MSVRSIGQFAIVALGVLSSSLAFARNPPSLVMRQEAAVNATQSSGGYRDINVRFGVVPARAPGVMRSRRRLPRHQLPLPGRVAVTGPNRLERRARPLALSLRL